MKRTVTKPFHDPVSGKDVHPGDTVKVTDNTRAAELEGHGLIAPKDKALPAAPSNKDAAKQRRNK